MLFEKFFKFFVVKAEEDKEDKEDEDLEDPQEMLRNQCKEDEPCKTLLEKYEECNERVCAKSKTTETCVEELLDYLHALDKCVSKDLFSKLK